MHLFAGRASLDVDIDDIDTDNEDDASDDPAIGWYGEEDELQGIRETDFDQDALPVSSVDSDDEEDGLARRHRSKWMILPVPRVLE